MVRQHVAVLLAASVADFERATSPWEIEWIVLPEIFFLAAGALNQASFVLSGLVAYPDAMQRNLRLTGGLVCTEAVIMALAPKMGREKAHNALSAICIAVSKGKGSLIDLLAQDENIAQVLDRAHLEQLIKPNNYLGLSGLMTDRVPDARRT